VDKERRAFFDFFGLFWAASQPEVLPKVLPTVGGQTQGQMDAADRRESIRLAASLPVTHADCVRNLQNLQNSQHLQPVAEDAPSVDDRRGLGNNL